MANQRLDGEDQEALFNNSYSSAVYYVQSPSSVSHANSDSRNNESAFVSPYRFTNPNPNQEVARLLSRYSSSRCSNNSFPHEKKIDYDIHSHGTGTENGDARRVNCVNEVEGDEDDGIEDGRKRSCWRFFSFGTSSSCMWFTLQISWRLMVSLGAALLVFFLATKPPPPKMFIKMTGIRQFEIGEGVDDSGVTTNILTCNCSMDLQIDNKSKLFGLHIRPMIIEMSFGHILLASSQSPKLFAESYGSTTFQLYVGTRNKAMYGAGRSMEDMLESGKGLPLVIRMRLSSSFRMVWNLIRPKFHHQAECLLDLDGKYDKRRHSHSYNSSCKITSYS